VRRSPRWTSLAALVDELAHTNVPGSRNEKRWQDVEELLGAGIDVITTVNIQHLESVNDVVAKITGVAQRETVPDSVVRAADQVELVDMAPEALRRRMAHGNVYAAEKVDAALSNYFRVGNLTALRELALLWTADKVDEALQTYRSEHEIEGTWETRERVVVALTGGPEGETLVRRAARIAARSSGGELLAVHVTRSDGLPGADPAALADQRRLVESLGGTYHQILGEDVPEALLAFARAENATQLVLGASRRSWLATLFSGPGIGATTIRDSGDIDVHIVTHSETGRGTRIPRLRGTLSSRRRFQGFVLAVALPPLLTPAVVPPGALNLVSDVRVFLLVWWWSPGRRLLPSWSAWAGRLLNYYPTPPLHTFAVAGQQRCPRRLVAVASLVSSWWTRRGAPQPPAAAESDARRGPAACCAGARLALLDWSASRSPDLRTCWSGRLLAKAAGRRHRPVRGVGGRKYARAFTPCGRRTAVRSATSSSWRSGAGRCTPTTSGWWAPSRPRPRSCSSASV
jgi:two-component system sensor histidine kinase KdpD